VARTLAWSLAALSGFAGLGYEIVWTQQLGVWLGHEYVAGLAVMAAFFAGLALGALALGGAIERSARPRAWYALCEGAIALWALALSVLMPEAGAWLSALIGEQPSLSWHWSVAFIGPLALLLPATCAMGATLPALARTLPRDRRAGLYAANTFGAVLGVLACALLWAPTLGLAQTARICAAMNALCALLGLLGLRPLPGDANVEGRASFALFFTGLLAIGYEVLSMRVLSQRTENTIYSFAALLALYLAGSALGAALQQRIGLRRDVLLTSVGATCLIGVASLRLPLELAFVAFVLPTVAMGALFSELSRAAASWGPALAANTLGAALAPLLFGLIVLPTLGAKQGLVLIALGYASLTRARKLSGSLLAGALAFGVFAPPLVIVDVPEGGQLTSYVEGVMAAVSVVQDADGVHTLRINNREQEGSDATLVADARQAWLPLLLHPHPRDALFLGLGTGVTASTATWDPALNVEAVELLPEVVAAAHRFMQGQPRIIVADARRYVRATHQLYDVIVADLYHPARSGSAALYTPEHFAAIRERLVEDGLFCQWLPLHQLDLDGLRSIVAAYLEVFPEATALLASNSVETPVFGLLGRNVGLGIGLAALRERIAKAPAQLKLDELAVLGSFLAGPGALRRFALGAQRNSDDRPWVAQHAPWTTHSEPARARLLALLKRFEVAPRDVVQGSVLDERLVAYWHARERYLALGAANTEDLLGLQQPLLEIVRSSADFRPAYDPLLNMAAVLPFAEARRLLSALSEARPERPEAARLLQQLAARH
jgi:spermidine synthase